MKCSLDCERDLHRQGFPRVVGIDEANFMGPELVEVAEQLADSGKQVIIAGLDTDYRRVFITTNSTTRKNSPRAVARAFTRS